MGCLKLHPKVGKANTHKIRYRRPLLTTEATGHPLWRESLRNMLLGTRLVRARWQEMKKH